MILYLQDKNKKIKKGLYIVSTPIGNLDDFTFRAVEILKKSDYILCEDTRVSKNLLNKYSINTKLISNHKFNEKKNLSKILAMLKSDKVVSLISDAGTPSISDPGSKLINECVINKIDIYPIPGPSAVSSAVSVSGFSEKFFFYGFFPEKEKNIHNDLNILSKIEASIVFFISPKKFNRSIFLLKKFFFGRKILICREISKLYEEYIRSDIDSLEPFSSNPKGELTIVISEILNNKKVSQKLEESDKKNIKKMIKKLSIKDITDLISQNKDISKKEIYNYCLKLKNEV